MDSLVFLAPNKEDSFTTSEVIAECAGVQHHKEFLAHTQRKEEICHA
jgi:phage regulator Rha-like protein